MNQTKIKFNIGDWKHYTSFDEDCGCDRCDRYSSWLHQQREERRLRK